ncbi:MAG: trypsin-like peptidase domain-containing protein [Ilumatobacteraceae bacterium]
MAAQPCRTPNRAFGVGVVVADGVVVTAAHTVEGPLRSLTVDGAPAEILAEDARTDLALLAASTPRGAGAGLSTASPAAATVLAADGDVAVRIASTGPLIVNDTTAGVRHHREVHQFTPGVQPGTSGAPLVDDRRRVLGIVVLDDRTEDIGYAVTATELAAVIDAPRGPPRTIGCADERRLRWPQRAARGEDPCDVPTSGPGQRRWR